MNNADEIVRALQNTCNGCNPTPCCEFEVLGCAAADLIESLQAENANLWEGITEMQVEIRKLDAQVESLQADLARVTAERDAAVKDMYLACKTSPCNNGVCVKRNCAGNTIPCDFEWRGVQAGEGGK